MQSSSLIPPHILFNVEQPRFASEQLPQWINRPSNIQPVNHVGKFDSKKIHDILGDDGYSNIRKLFGSILNHYGQYCNITSDDDMSFDYKAKKFIRHCYINDVLTYAYHFYDNGAVVLHDYATQKDYEICDSWSHQGHGDIYNHNQAKSDYDRSSQMQRTDYINRQQGTLSKLADKLVNHVR